MRSHVQGLEDGLSRAELEKLRELLSPAECAEGERLCTEGTAPSGLYIIREGVVSVTKKDNSGEDRCLANIEAPTVIGEVEFINHGESVATVTAATDLKADLLSLENFDRLHELGPMGGAKFVRNIARILVRRLEHANTLYADVVDWSR